MTLLTAISAPQTATISPNDDPFWAQVRSHFILEKGQIYLNNSSLGLPPRPVAEAVGRGFERLSQNPTAAKRKFAQYIEQSVRPALSQFLGARPEEIAFTRNATESLYNVVNGLRLQAGDQALMTTQEHPSAVRPWSIRATRTGISVGQVPIPSPLVSAEDIVHRMSQAIDERSKVLFFCHITRGGYLYPVKALAALARARGLVSAIDGAQAIGGLPVDLGDMGCDLYANSLHKWFLGPSGTGFLYVRGGFAKKFGSLYFDEDEGDAGATRFEESGTYDLPVRAALGTALDFLNRIGIGNIEARLRYLSDYLREQLRTIPRVQLLSSASHELSSPGATLFEIDRISGSSLVGPFFEDGIHIDDHTRDGHDALRISTHYYVTIQEIDLFIAKLKSLIG